LNISQQVSDFVVNEFIGKDFSEEFSNTFSLIESGILDSLAIVKLVEFVEKKFSLEINEDDLTPENFDNIDSISSLLKSKLDK